MHDPVHVERNGHRTWLKWHRGRRRRADPVFTGQRILEGMALGASIEVDLVVTGDKGFAVLHNLDLSEETTGIGLVADTSDAALRQLQLRDNDGAPIPDKVMLLDDLCALMVSGSVHPDALLQLDYKEDDSVLDATALANFARATRPVAGNLILSSGNAKAIAMLAAEVPGIRVGFDPSDEARVNAARASGSHAAFVAETLAAAPTADLIYLYWQIPLLFAEDGFDIIAAFHAAGKRVDAWTIREVNPDSLAQVERLLALKVDQITTDDPEGLAMALQS
ncbi:glycerophosphodiester phosphodiesterase [Devosia beringensis]|uniref:glycerophosphodiester phosphodiesterase n=1 Tax=Devosia beringensis TaxID=2657486 RepID=UPI00186B80D2|nr:glycerophosphodiester phosphodiesterase family protein [Devosia beringensis]